MKIIRTLLMLLCLGITAPAFAQDEPLLIAVETFNPPFVLQAANNQLYGFDISMMEYLCKKIQRKCQFTVLPFDEVLPAVISKKVDVAVSSIAITLDRARTMNFTNPYLPSHCRFIGTTPVQKGFYNLQELNNKKIGIIDGSMFENEISAMGIKDPEIYRYKHSTDIINALIEKEIDLALIDDPGQVYLHFWEANSGGQIHIIGPSIPYGIGLGIAVNKTETALLESLNQALNDYHQSEQFRKDFNKYIGGL